jgi:hypothetical protein
MIDGRMVHYLEQGHATNASVLALHGGGQTQDHHKVADSAP